MRRSLPVDDAHEPTTDRPEDKDMRDNDATACRLTDGTGASYWHYGGLLGDQSQRLRWRERREYALRRQGYRFWTGREDRHHERQT